MFRVTMTLAGKPVKKYTFDKPTISIGRDAVCDVVVENIGASRCHATIEKTEDGYVLADLKSHNGTFVGGEKVFHHRLRETDEFQIGKYAFQFEALDPTVAETKPAPGEAAPARAADMTFALDRNEIARLIGHVRKAGASQLVQIAPEGEKRNVVLDKSYCLIGSGASCAVKVAGLFVAAKAGVLVRCENGWRIVGLSRGLLVNGKRVDDGPLSDGDLVQLGRRRFRFCQA